MQLMDPTVDAPHSKRARAPLFNTLDGLTIGLLTNGKVNADKLIEQTAALFVEHHRCSTTKMYAKTNAARRRALRCLKNSARKVIFLLPLQVTEARARRAVCTTALPTSSSASQPLFCVPIRSK